VSLKIAKAKSSELADRIRELESKLSESVVGTQLRSAKAEAESRILKLHGNLSERRSEAEALNGKLAIPKDVAKKLLSPVPQQDRFSFYSDIDTPTAKLQH
jgi:predicted RNase H-like nuclease (RuvC/YqgF family)